MEPAVIDNSYDNEDVPNQCQQIGSEEQGKHSHLHLLIDR